MSPRAVGAEEMDHSAGFQSGSKSWQPCGINYMLLPLKVFNFFYFGGKTVCSPSLSLLPTFLSFTLFLCNFDAFSLRHDRHAMIRVVAGLGQTTAFR